jgi:rRNA maturation RNase YbeY
MSELVLRNRQRAHRVNTPLLRRIVRSLLGDLIGVDRYELCVHLVGTSEMTSLNETFLHHAGSTDVITFDYKRNEPTPDPSQEGNSISCADRSSPLGRGKGWVLHGEIFVCVDEAIRQARRFRTSWQSELVRYVVHGVLHLRGFDDQRTAARSKMKREENHLLHLLAARFPLSRLARKTTLHS